MSASVLFRVTVLACTLVACGASAAQAATTLVPNRFDDPLFEGESCKPQVAGKCSLRGAIGDSEDGDTIVLGAGTYTLSFGQLAIDENLTIVGAGPGLTTIKQTVVGRVIDAHTSGGLTISGVTITGGNLIAANGEDGVGTGANGDDGAIAEGAGLLGSGTVRLTDVVISGNSAFGGDGGDGASGSMSTPGGEGGRGGDVFGAGTSGATQLVLLRVAITGNAGFPGDAGAGGGAAVGGSAGNGGVGSETVGAGVSTGSSALTATDSLIAGNAAHTSPGGPGGNSGPLAKPGKGGQGESSNGGGLFSNGPLKLTNVTIAGNVAEGGTGGPGGNAQNAGSATTGGAGGAGIGGEGGGVAMLNGAVATFASVTIAGNQAGIGSAGPGGTGSSGGAGGATGALFAPRGGNVGISDAALQMRGTLIADGLADTGTQECSVVSGGTLTSLGNNLIGRSAQCIVAPEAGDKVGAAANLGPLADHGGLTQTLALLPGSAAINAGAVTCLDADGVPLATDQRGAPRLSPCDIGAFELQPSEIPGPPASAPPGGAGAGSSAGTPKQPGIATLSQLKLMPKKPRIGGKATISFALDVATQVDFALQRKLRGVKSGRKCIRPAPGAGAKGKACVRLVKAGGAPKPLAATAGANQLAWTPRGLQPGRYQLTATPAGGLPRIVGFKLQPKPARR